MAWFSLHLPFSLWLSNPFSSSRSLLLFQTFSPSSFPKILTLCLFYLSLPLAFHFGCPFILSSFPSSFLLLPHLSLPSHTSLSILPFLFLTFFQQCPALTELQLCFHSERRSSYGLCYPNFHPWVFLYTVPPPTLFLFGLFYICCLLSLSPKGVLREK